MRLSRTLLVSMALAAATSIALTSPALAQPTVAERLLIDKSDRTLKIIFGSGGIVTLGGVHFGPNWRDGPKRQRGDRKTPEGNYRVLEHRTSRLLYPDVTYLPALYLDYPNEQDRMASAALGLDPGDAIMIHGPHPDMAGYPLQSPGDWTDGCAALTAEQMDYLMRVTAEGTVVTIQP